LRKIILETTLEALKALLPIVIAIIILQFTVLRVPIDMFLNFLVGGGMVFLGMVSFWSGSGPVYCRWDTTSAPRYLRPAHCLSSSS